MTDEDAPSGWALVEEYDAAPKVIATLLTLDAGGVYTRAELAEAADVTLKQLYLDGTLGAFAELGVLERVEGDGEAEARYRVAADHALLEAAAAFDEAVRENRE